MYGLTLALLISDIPMLAWYLWYRRREKRNERPKCPSFLPPLLTAHSAIAGYILGSVLLDIVLTHQVAGPQFASVTKLAYTPVIVFAALSAGLSTTIFFRTSALRQSNLPRWLSIVKRAALAYLFIGIAAIIVASGFINWEVRNRPLLPFESPAPCGEEIGVHVLNGKPVVMRDNGGGGTATGTALVSIERQGKQGELTHLFLDKKEGYGYWNLNLTGRNRISVKADINNKPFSGYFDINVPAGGKVIVWLQFIGNKPRVIIYDAVKYKSSVLGWKHINRNQPHFRG